MSFREEMSTFELELDRIIKAAPSVGKEFLAKLLHKKAIETDVKAVMDSLNAGGGNGGKLVTAPELSASAKDMSLTDNKIAADPLVKTDPNTTTQAIPAAAPDPATKPAA